MADTKHPNARKGDPGARTASMKNGQGHPNAKKGGGFVDWIARHFPYSTAADAKRAQKTQAEIDKATGGY